MDQLTYRSGKWDIINVTLNNNILIYCAARTELRLRSALEAAIVNTMTLLCPNLRPIPSKLMDLVPCSAFMKLTLCC